MFKLSSEKAEQYNKMIEKIFSKNFTDKSFSSLRFIKEIGQNLSYKDDSSNEYYLFKKDNNVWKKVTDPDVIEVINKA